MLNNRKMCLSFKITFLFIQCCSNIHSFILYTVVRLTLSLIFTVLEFTPKVLEMSLVCWIKRNCKLQNWASYSQIQCIQRDFLQQIVHVPSIVGIPRQSFFFLMTTIFTMVFCFIENYDALLMCLIGLIYQVAV